MEVFPGTGAESEPSELGRGPLASGDGAGWVGGGHFMAAMEAAVVAMLSPRLTTDMTLILGLNDVLLLRRVPH